MFAWCRLRDDARVFRLDRVQAARLANEQAPERDLRAAFGEIPADVVPGSRMTQP